MSDEQNARSDAMLKIIEYLISDDLSTRKAALEACKNLEGSRPSDEPIQDAVYTALEGNPSNELLEASGFILLPTEDRAYGALHKHFPRPQAIVAVGLLFKTLGLLAAQAARAQAMAHRGGNPGQIIVPTVGGPVH